MKNALNIKNITVNYDKTPVLWDISLTVPPGTLTGILGPNGAGKTTLLKTILGLIKPISGKIEVFNMPICKLQKKIAYVPQRESIDWDFPITVFDLVLMGRYGHLGLFRWPRKADKEAALKALDFVGMKSFAKRQISELSGGQQQRIFLARAITQDPIMYIMDEPFSGVDLATEKVIMNLLQKLKTQGKTILVVHHDLNTVMNYFDRVVMINLRLIAAGPTDEYFNANTLAKTFGKNNVLLNEVLQLTKDRTLGIS